jgi:hypothetical protein
MQACIFIAGGPFHGIVVTPPWGTGPVVAATNRSWGKNVSASSPRKPSAFCVEFLTFNPPISQCSGLWPLPRSTSDVRLLSVTAERFFSGALEAGHSAWRVVRVHPDAGLLAPRRRPSDPHRSRGHGPSRRFADAPAGVPGHFARDPSLEAWNRHPTNN